VNDGRAGGNMGFRKTVMLLVLMALSLAAGVELGWAWRPGQFNAGAEPHNPGPRPWFEQLDLTADQQKQFEKIWGDTRQQMHQLGQQYRDLEKSRETQIMALLTAEQKAGYEKINQGIRASRDEMDKQREASIADANSRSRALLSPEQQQKWDELSKDIRRRRGGFMGSSTQHSTTQPSFEGEGHHNHGDHN
jgi:Spy/CpxP family protein refolding chaperone